MIPPMIKRIFLVLPFLFVLSMVSFSQYSPTDTTVQKRSLIGKTTDLADKMIDMATWEKPMYTFSLFPILQGQVLNPHL